LLDLEAMMMNGELVTGYLLAVIAKIKRL